MQSESFWLQQNVVNAFGVKHHHSWVDHVLSDTTHSLFLEQVKASRQSSAKLCERSTIVHISEK